MIDRKFISLINKYLKENYMPLPKGMNFSIGKTSLEEKSDKYAGIIGAIRYNIDKLFNQLELQGTFGQYVRDLIRQKGLNEVEVYKKAQIDKRLFSNLRRYKNYTTNVRTIWALAFAMEMNLEEVENLMLKAGYNFASYDKESIIIKCCFENHLHDLFLVNEILYEYGFKPLGNSNF